MTASDWAGLVLAGAMLVYLFAVLLRAGKGR